MILYRITKARYANDLSGLGVRLYGGRWNNVGYNALYLASSRSLAVLESLAHISPTNIPDDLVLLSIEVPDDFIAVDSASLPDNWKGFPEPNILKQIGNSFLEQNKNLLLKVPSALVPNEFNYIMNPLHNNTGKVRIITVSPFAFDDRLIHK